MNLRVFAALIILTTSVAFSQSPVHETFPPGMFMEKSPSGSWRPWHNVTPRREWHEAVARLKTPRGSGSCVMISCDTAVTAYHCFADVPGKEARYTEEASVIFQDGETLKCTFLSGNAARDIAIVQLSGSRCSFLALAAKPPAVGSVVELAGYHGFNKDRLYAWRGEITGYMLQGTGGDTYANTATTPGDSGGAAVQHGKLCGVILGGFGFVKTHASGDKSKKILLTFPIRIASCRLIRKNVSRARRQQSIERGMKQ